MAIETNKSSEEVIGSVKYYTGVGNFKVVAINPTMEEAQAIGVNLRTEPEYTDIQVGENVRNRITFFVKNTEKDIITRVDFLVYPEKRVSQNGNVQIINEYGRHTWGASVEAVAANPKMSWFKTENANEAYIGQAELTDFVAAWANVASDGKITFDTIDNIVRGNVTELRQLMASIADNEIRLLLGVKVTDEGKQYQTVYSKWYGRPYHKNFTTLRKRLGEEYGEFKSQYDPTDFTLKEFNGAVLATTASSTEQTEDEPAPWEQGS